MILLGIHFFHLFSCSLLGIMQPKHRSVCTTTDPNHGKRAGQDNSVIDLANNAVAISQPLDAPAPKRYKFGAADEKQPGADGGAAAAASAGVNDGQSLATLVALVKNATEENSFVQFSMAVKLLSARTCELNCKTILLRIDFRLDCVLLLLPFPDAETLLAELVHDRRVHHPRYTLIQISNEEGRLPTFALFEQWDSESSVKLVGEWTRTAFPPITSPSVDVFNCKVDYSSTATVVGLERLNVGLAEETPRYLLLADTANSRDLVAVLLKNAVAITHHLKQASLLLIDTPSRLAEGKDAVSIIHTQLARLHEIKVSFPDIDLMVNGFERIGGTRAFESKLNEWVATSTSTPMHNVALRYRATEHGWAAADFHRTCDNVPRLLVIARSTSGFVFGGFTSVGFGGADGTYKADASAFLFTLINPHGIVPTMLLSKESSSHSLRQHSDYGADFGLSIMFHSNCNTMKGSSCHESVCLVYSDTTGKGPALFTGMPEFGTMAEILAFSV
jgi:hypothetical protein